MAGSLLPQPKQIAFDSAFNPGIAYQFYTYDTGTLTPKATYQDAALSIPNTNPVIANARGEVVMYGTGQYRVILKDSLGNTVWDRDNIGNSDLSTADLVGFLQAGTGAASRSVQEKLRDAVSVKDFGAKTDGTDCSTAIQNAIASLPASGGTIRFPAGTYVFSGVAITKPLRILCDGGSDGGVTWSNPTASSPTFSATNVSGIYMSGFKATASAVRTGGKLLDFVNCNRMAIKDFFMEKYFVGIGLDGGSEITIDKFQMFDGAAAATYPNSGAILIGDNNYTGSVTIPTGYIKCQDTAKQCAYGIRAKYVDVLNIGSGVTIISHGNNLDIVPASGQTASLIKSFGAIYDTAVNGINFAPTGTGRVLRCDFHAGWYGANSISGVVIDGTAGIVDGINFFGGDAVSNTSCGFNVFGANADNIRIKGVNIGGNGIGVRSVSNADLHVEENTIGGVGLAPANTTGMATDSTITGVLARNRFTTNTTALSGPYTAAGLQIFDNLGIDNWIAYTPTVTAETGAITSSAPSMRYVQRYQTIHYEATVDVGNNGTGAGAVRVTLPKPIRISNASAGRAAAISGKMLQVFADGGLSYVRLANYDGTYPAVNGERLVFSGTYETN